ncbi:MAG: hypothetical protein KatS3mg054_1375 [Chloroflexus sp.]|nr:MAG: hypothetical protein KatS3mg054_1375 [Chloroflexus sp.]
MVTGRAIGVTLDLHHLAILNEHGAQHLVSGRSGNLHFDGQAGQEGANGTRSHRARMVQVMKADEPAHRSESTPLRYGVSSVCGAAHNATDRAGWVNDRWNSLPSDRE